MVTKILNQILSGKKTSSVAQPWGHSCNSCELANRHTWWDVKQGKKQNRYYGESPIRRPMLLAKTPDSRCLTRKLVTREPQHLQRRQLGDLDRNLACDARHKQSRALGKYSRSQKILDRCRLHTHRQEAHVPQGAALVRMV